ncbi:trypsin-like peptidase domain-containing protein [Amycolatopsis thailandensis]|uniref:trypsin-like peptidase domain-containing protein n=1 Tax=Amycolatopsis thailandensis TaxID=589330 RepID=UPI00364D4222
MLASTWATVELLSLPLVTPSGAGRGTGFFVAPGLLLTSGDVIAEGLPLVDDDLFLRTVPQAADFDLISDPADEEFALLRASDRQREPYAALSDDVAVGDTLQVFGFAVGDPRKLLTASLRLSEPSQFTVVDGRIEAGFSGGPVVNERTGAVCGVARYENGTARVMPISDMLQRFPGFCPAPRFSHRWLELLDDEQREALRSRRPGASRLAEYQTAIAGSGARPLLGDMLGVTAPAVKIRLRSDDRRDPSVTEVQQDHLILHPDAQLVGGKGAGKSSMLRQLTVMLAGQRIQGEGDLVPVPVKAKALATHGTVPELLAKGVADGADLDLSLDALTALFAEPPFDGGRWFVLVDGFSEVRDPQWSNMVLQRIRRERDDGKYAFLLAADSLSRHELDVISRDGRDPTYALGALGDGELLSLAEKWLRELDVPRGAASATGFLERVAEAGASELAALPLPATMFAVLYTAEPGRALPQNKAALYGAFIGLLLERRLPGREYLLEPIVEVLKELACAGPEPGRLSVPANDDFDQNALSTRRWPHLVHDLLTSSGLIADVQNEFLVDRQAGSVVFTDETVRDYLTACRLADQHPNPSRLKASRVLDTSGGLGTVKAFLVGIWAAEEKNIARPLLRLLKRRNPVAAYRFVADLPSQGISLPPTVRKTLSKRLSERVASVRAVHTERREAGAILRRLDKSAAIRVYETLARLQPEDARAYEAIDILLKHAPSLAVSSLLSKCKDRRINAWQKLIFARMLYDADAAQGMHWLTLLVRNGPDDVWPEAVQVVSTFDREHGILLLQEKIATAVRDSQRLQAAQLLMSFDPDLGTAELSQLTRDQGIEPQVRLAAAVVAMPRLPDNGAGLFAHLAGEDRLDPEIRIKACEHLGDDDRAVRVLDILATDSTVEAAIRCTAAELHFRLRPDSGLPMLLDLIADPRLGHSRIAAARAVGRRERDHAAGLLAGLADDQANDVTLRRSAGLALVEFDKAAAAAVLTRLAKTGGGHHRLAAAVALAGVDQQAGIDVLWAIIRSFAQLETREKAAAELTKLDRGDGKAAYGLLVDDLRLPVDTRIRLSRLLARYDKAAAIAAVRRIVDSPIATQRQRSAALTQLGQFSPREAMALRSKQANASAAPPTSTRELDKLAKLSKPRQIKAYNERIGNAKLDASDRLEAADRLTSLSPKEARAGFELIEADRKVPKKFRDKAAKAARKIR